MGIRFSGVNDGKSAGPTSRLEDRSTGSRVPLSLILLLLLAGGVVPATVAGTGNGAFRPPHTDLGIDANTDGQYNYLRIVVRLTVSSGGTFTIRVVLNDDLDLALLTEKASTLALPVGEPSVSIDLSGVDIYNGGVDGPYYAHLTLQSDYGAVIATDVHVTAAYRFTDFQAFDARFVSPRSERTLDNDTDGLVDWLELGFTIEVATPATYTLSSLLTDSTYTVALRWTQTVSLTAGRTTLQQLFMGYPIRIAARSGPYLVTNSLYDDRNVLANFLYVETRAYNYTIFETPPVRLEPPHRDAGVDAGTDGLYDVLRVDVNLGVESAGTYTLRGQLFSSGGYLIGSSTTLLAVASGAARAALEFPGSTIHDAGLDGPYRVAIEVFDSSVRRLDAGTHWTASYAAGDFQPRTLYLEPPHEDHGVDADGDGRFEALEVIIHVNVTSASTVRIAAALRQGVLAPDLVRVSVNVSVAPGLRSIPVFFPGSDIIDAGIDGPYRVWIEIYGPDGVLLDKDSHRTLAYILSDFEAVPSATILALVSDRGEDIDGDGAINRLRATVSVNVTESGKYRFEGTLARGTQRIVTSVMVEELKAGRSDVGLVFGGPEIRAAGVDGPFDLGLTVRSLDGLALASAVLPTSAYPVASFEPAVPAALTGDVQSAWAATPLLGARVWLADYDNHVFREATTDTGGRYALSAYEGTYWLIVDHPDAEAYSTRTTLRGSGWLNASLGVALRTVVQDTLTWAGWDSLLLSVRYQHTRDAASLRYDLDWQGNRDGWVQPWEEAFLAVPVDRIRDAIDARATSGYLSVNFVDYGAVGETFLVDTVAGDVASAAVPVRQVILAFQSQYVIGGPPRLFIAFDTYYDTTEVDRSARLYLPGQYRFVSSNQTGDVLVRARRYVNPVVVDPIGTLEAAEPPGIAFLGTMFYTQTSYAPGTPSAPTGLFASSTGTAVELTWLRPQYHTDGSTLRNLAGYYVYRGASSSGPFLRVSGLVPWERFTDRSASGTAVYRVTAVNTDGIESAMSEGAGVVLAATGDPTGPAEVWGNPGGLTGSTPPEYAALATGAGSALAVAGCLLGFHVIRRVRGSRKSRFRR